MSPVDDPEPSPTVGRHASRPRRARTYVIAMSMGSALGGALFVALATPAGTDVWDRISSRPVSFTASELRVPEEKSEPLDCGSVFFEPADPMLLDKDIADDESLVAVAVVAGKRGPITITDITVDVQLRKAPLEGRSRSAPCGDQEPAAYIQFDLDEEPPRTVASSRESRLIGDDEWRLTPMSYPWVVAGDVPVVLLMSATTQECYCQWVAVIHWQVDGESGTTVVDNDGEPFEVTASSNI